MTDTGITASTREQDYRRALRASSEIQALDTMVRLIAAPTSTPVMGRATRPSSRSAVRSALICATADRVMTSSRA
jgi:hypothetical protein